jgi:hypothetical protein
VKLGIELRVTSYSTICGVMLLGMVLYMMTSRTVPLAAPDLDMELPW